MSALLCSRLTKVLSPWAPTGFVLRRPHHPGWEATEDVYVHSIFLGVTAGMKGHTPVDRQLHSPECVHALTHSHISAVICVTCDSSQSMLSHVFPYPCVRMCVLAQALFHPHISKLMFAYFYWRATHPHRAGSSSWVLASLPPSTLCIPTTNPLPPLNGFSWTTKPLRIILFWSQIGAQSVLQPIHTITGRKC